MIDLQAVKETIELYEKHGWVLRRLVLTKPDRVKFETALSELCQDVPIQDAEINAACFSRLPKKGGNTWEIRYLGEPAYALVENLVEEDPLFESNLAKLELRLIEAVGRKKQA